jgi:ATP/maltotriose-dependent transcriptional regulator MalT
LLLATCLVYVARVSLRLGRVEDAVAQLAEARANFEQIGAADDIPAVDARIAECHVYRGAFREAFELANGMLQRASSSAAIGKLAPHLQRVRALALLGLGDASGARGAAEESLRDARSRQDRFEVLLALLLLKTMNHQAGIQPTEDREDEAAGLIAQFKIKGVPKLPDFVR